MKKAFTLIEMMVVVAIIGLLTVTAVLGFGRQRATARETRRIQDVGTIRDAIEQYQTLGNTLPVVDWWKPMATSLNPLVTQGLLNSLPDEQNPATGDEPWCAHYAFWSTPTDKLEGPTWKFKGNDLGLNRYMVLFGSEFTGSDQNVHSLNNNVWSYPTKQWCNGDRGLGLVFGSSS